jgi:hypothetical protein
LIQRNSISSWLYRKSEVIAECMDLDTVRWYEIQASPK